VVKSLNLIFNSPAFLPYKITWSLEVPELIVDQGEEQYDWNLQFLQILKHIALLQWFIYIFLNFFLNWRKWYIW